MRSSLDYGSVPGWISAIATTVGLGGIALTLRQYRRQQQKESDEFAEQLLRPARLVTFVPRSNVVDGTRLLNERFEVDATNDGDGPVLEVEVRVLHYPDGDLAFESKPVELPHRDVASDKSMRIPAHSASVLKFDLEARIPRDSVLRFEYRYTDANGRRWIRTGSEQPRPE